jgi:hypothetical protein
MKTFIMMAKEAKHFGINKKEHRKWLIDLLDLIECEKNELRQI